MLPAADGVDEQFVADLSRTLPRDKAVIVAEALSARSRDDAARQAAVFSGLGRAGAEAATRRDGRPCAGRENRRRPTDAVAWAARRRRPRRSPRTRNAHPAATHESPVDRDERLRAARRDGRRRAEEACTTDLPYHGRQAHDATSALRYRWPMSAFFVTRSSRRCEASRARRPFGRLPSSVPSPRLVARHAVRLSVSSRAWEIP